MSIKKFISIDWGTTNFRLRLVDYNSLEIIKEITNGDGVKKVHDSFFKNKSSNQKDFFLNYINKLINQLKIPGENIPIVISGMASSTLGVQELKYSELPITLDGENLFSRRLSSSLYKNIFLVSGAKTTEDIIRGEETQALGFLTDIDKGILILPGTHSKHVVVKNQKIIDFKTYLTGELFDLITNYSILKSNIESTSYNILESQFFLDGLEKGFSKKMTHYLFSIRSKEILQKIDRKENYFFLSGLLIGDELNCLNKNYQNIYIAGSSKISKMYEIACRRLFVKSKITLFTEEETNTALFKGQKKILAKYGY